MVNLQEMDSKAQPPRPGSGSWRSFGGRRGPLTLCLSATAAFVVLLFAANGGTRGSDQFWYVADTETLLKGKPPLNNMVFPGLMLRGESSRDSMFFVHNSLILHAVVPFAALFGPHDGWIVFSALAAIGTAAIMYHLVFLLAGGWPAALSYTCYLLNPVTVWSTSNPLQEISWGLVSAILLVLMIRARADRRSWALLSLAATIAILCNPVYILIALGVPCVRLFEQFRWPRASDLLYISIAFAAAMLVNSQKMNWLPDSAHPSVREIIISTIPGKTNLEWHYVEDIPPITLDLLWNKLVWALGYQASTNHLAVFFAPINLTLIGTLLFACTQPRDYRSRRLLIGAAALVGLVAVIAFLHQNQFRYASVYLPATISATVIGVSRVLRTAAQRKGAVIATALLIAGFLAVDLTAARYTRDEGLQSRRAIASLQEAIASAEHVDRIWAEVSIGESMLVAYAVRPRPCLSTRAGYQNDEQLRELLEVFDPDVLICAPDSRLLDLLQVSAVETELQKPLKRFRVYERLRTE
ncbi:MAG: hypothetical protein AB7N71_14635 [Phycisphaerae bacterium]